MEAKLLNPLEEQLCLTQPDSEPEPYILTREEEEIVIANELETIKKNKTWKMADMKIHPEQILLKLAAIDWDKEIDKTEILKRANSSRHYEIWEKEQRVKDKEEAIKKREELKKRCDAKYIFNLISWTSKNTFGKQLIVHDDNKKLITTLCFFLSNDERFESELGYSFKKGLLIRGVAGLGKTHLVQCASLNELNPVLVLSMIDITDWVKDQGEYIMDLKENKIIYLDDVGTEEPVVNHFGTKISYFKNFIELTYLKTTSFNRLIISTNSSFLEIEEKYGFRVRSRMREMFNIIDVAGKDMRK